MSIIQGNAHTSAGGGYQIERSLRFNSADSAYLNRTVGSAATSNTLTTFSFWFKRAKLGTSQQLFASATSAPNVACYIELTTSDTLRIYLDMTAGGSDETSWVTTAVFRDVSAWYGATIKVDTSQASNANKVVLYINNVSQTLTASQTGTAVSTQRILENGISLTIGKYFNSSGYGDFYLTEFYAIDGQALTPSSFGETDTNTGVWKPKAYSGTYGTNGFYLKFADNSGTTSTTLGKDSSGNGNNWTPNNFSVTAGAGNDSLVDSPTAYGTDTGVGGEVRGNYATWNPLDKRISGASTFANGNLDATVGASGSTEEACATITFPSSGSWYCEMTCSNVASGNARIGIGNSAIAIDSRPANGYLYQQDGQKYVLGSASAYGSSYTTGDVIGIAFNASAGSITFYKNNTSQGAITGISTSSIWVITATGKATVWIANFGQRAFAYTAPSGFKALCTQNLPTPTIGATSTTQANDYFNVVTYTGNGSTQSITGVGFQPDFVWGKSRTSGTDNHILSDAVRGATKQLISNLSDAEYSVTNLITAFNSDGFSLGSNGQLNTNTNSYVAWNWKANGAGSSNTAGTITSTVSANTTSGFSIVTYTGTGSAATIGHGLGAVPSMIIVKNRDQADAWQVYHSANTANPETDYLVLNTTAATADAADRWNDTLPTSTLFSIGNGVEVNTNTEKYVAYVFAPVAGYSAFGSYTGNGSADGPFVYTGFRPAFVMIKPSSAADNWQIEDSARNTFNVINTQLFPNLSNAEATSTTRLTDFLSNGFKIRGTNAGVNGNGTTFIYAAFAESPFKYALAR